MKTTLWRVLALGALAVSLAFAAAHGDTRLANGGEVQPLSTWST